MPRAVTIPSFFTSPEIRSWSWLWKIAFTAVTLSAGFKGGRSNSIIFHRCGAGQCARRPLAGARHRTSSQRWASSPFSPAPRIRRWPARSWASSFLGRPTASISRPLASSPICSAVTRGSTSPSVSPCRRPASRHCRRRSRSGTSAKWKSPLLGNSLTRSPALPFLPAPTTTPPCHPRNTKSPPREIGMLRIYLKPADKRKQPGLRGFPRHPPALSRTRGRGEKGRHHERPRPPHPLRLQQSRQDPGARPGNRQPGVDDVRRTHQRQKPARTLLPHPTASSCKTRSSSTNTSSIGMCTAPSWSTTRPPRRNSKSTVSKLRFAWSDFECPSAIRRGSSDVRAAVVDHEDMKARRDGFLRVFELSWFIFSAPRGDEVSAVRYLNDFLLGKKPGAAQLHRFTLA